MEYKTLRDLMIAHGPSILVQAKGITGSFKVTEGKMNYILDDGSGAKWVISKDSARSLATKPIWKLFT